MTSRLAIIPSLLLLAACGGSAPPAAGSPATPAATNAEPPAPRSGGSDSALTAEECEKQGGHVVGDIGDGAIHRPDYRCPGSGQPPLGPIKLEPGRPVPIEGSVCCR
jgi:hypothetical protein